MNKKSQTLYIQKLSQEIEKNVGITVLKFEDCKTLSKKLALKKIAISPHTVARIFKVLKSNHRPYISTLNLLAEFLGYESFSAFCTSKETGNRTQLSRPYSFDTGDFSFTALELCIQTCQWKHMQEILESYRIDERKNELSMFLGNAVRQHPDRNNFLKALIDVEMGKFLFYETFVDEDDPGNYYTNALEKYYLKTKTEKESKLFQTCFTMAKRIYKEEPIAQKSIQYFSKTEFDVRKLHFHLFSRYIEIRILIKKETKNNLHENEKIIFELLAYISNYTLYERSWILARSIKALFFRNEFIPALEIQEYKKQILKTYHELNGKMSSVGDLIIQYVYFAFFYKKKNDSASPKRLEVKHLNETQSRIAIESATAFLFAEGKIKSYLESNLEPFAKQSGQSWLLNVLCEAR